MEQRTLTRERLRSGWSVRSDAHDAVREVIGEIGDVDAAAVLFFTSPALDGRVVGDALRKRFPTAVVVGCTSAGEFTQRGTATEGLSAVALPTAIVRRAAAGLADLDGGVDEAVRAAFGEVERELGTPLRDADPSRYIGLLLVDGLHGSEERVNEMLGNLAPLMSFVGGSAGDDLRFVKTEVFYGDRVAAHGAVLLVLDAAVPFSVVKTCSFEPTDQTLTITAADAASRVVWEFDGRPAAEVYAEAVGRRPEDLGSEVFMSHPVGLMIDGEPWIRSPMQVIDGRGVKFYCQVLPGMQVNLMRGTDLVGETGTALRRAVDEVGGEASGAVMFNCILRRLELDATKQGDAFVGALGGIPTAGFHTYGESWLGHINQTLTGVVFGR